MQTQHRRFLDSIDWDGYHGSDATAVQKDPDKGSERDVDDMLYLLGSICQDRLDEYKESLYYTTPSKERREAEKQAEYRIQHQPDHAPISGTHG